MRCDMCQSGEASVHIHETVDGKETVVNLCPGCAEANGVLRVGSEGVNLGALFCDVTIKAVIKPPAANAEAAVDNDVACPDCGLSARIFASGGRLGCGTCYTVFADQVAALIGRTQRGSTHLGSRPGKPRAVSAPAARLGVLRSELARAVASESYEQAAELRDAIRQIGCRCTDQAQA